MMTCDRCEMVTMMVGDLSVPVAHASGCPNTGKVWDSQDEEWQDEEGDDTSETCSTCAGSGEGPADGTRCWRCKGTGELYASRADDDDDADFRITQYEEDRYYDRYR